MQGSRMRSHQLQRLLDEEEATFFLGLDICSKLLDHSVKILDTDNTPPRQICHI
jgi:hypothetical protein